MRDATDLVEGYRRFRANRFPKVKERYKSLADTGQTPKTMVISCCDSRVGPIVIFDAYPGELFVSRNVANLVPAWEPEDRHVGSTAAIEYAVSSLKVEVVLVLGHSRCGGVRAFLDGRFDTKHEPRSIDAWMSQLQAPSDEVLRDIGSEPVEVQQMALEQASIRHSIQNLLTYPYDKERVYSGHLRLRGAYFNIADGAVLGLHPQSGHFESLD